MEILKSNFNWTPVKLEGPICNDNLEQLGLIGIEELTDYHFDSESTEVEERSTKNKRKFTESEIDPEDVPVRKTKVKKLKHDKKDNCLNKNVKINYVLSRKRLESLQKEINKHGKKPKRKEKIKVEVGVSVKDPEKGCSIEDMTEWHRYGLYHEILKALAEEGFRRPTLIQSLTLPPAIFGCRDILGAAETGSGKTLAFGLPIINGILKIKNDLSDDKDITEGKNISDSESTSEDNEQEENNESCNSNEIGFVKSVDKILKSDKDMKLKPLYALILTPTRELAVQIKNHLISAARYTGIKVAVVFGGMATVKQERVLSKCPEIVVATPGRLWEFIQTGNPHLSQIDNIRYLVIDETDRMMERGHFEELHQLLDRLNADEEHKKKRQNFVFSATLTLVHDLPVHLLRKKWHKNKIKKLTPEQKLQQLIEILGITNPKVIDITKNTGTASTLTECRITCPIEDKDYYLYYFLKRHSGRTIVFCNSIGCVKRLTTLFNVLEYNPLPLHAMMHQKQRLKNLERFRDDNQAILIATDVAARGLDIPKIQHVIHYQCPRTAENYVHRSGRTARAEEEGITVLFMEPSELKSYIRLCKTLGRAEDLPIFPVDDNLLSSVKQRINLARDLDSLELQLRKKSTETGWFQKAINEMDIIVDEEEMPKQMFAEDISKIRKAINVKRKQLSSLLLKPLFPKGFSTKYLTSNINADNSSLIPQVESRKNAIEVMKTALENYARSGKTIGSLAPKLKIKKNTSIRKKKKGKKK